jgi:hypothetical protein
MPSNRNPLKSSWLIGSATVRVTPLRSPANRQIKMTSLNKSTMDIQIGPSQIERGLGSVGDKKTSEMNAFDHKFYVASMMERMRSRVGRHFG